jgi:hypothetical protein
MGLTTDPANPDPAYALMMTAAACAAAARRLGKTAIVIRMLRCSGAEAATAASTSPPAPMLITGTAAPRSVVSRELGRSRSRVLLSIVAGRSSLWFRGSCPRTCISLMDALIAQQTNRLLRGAAGPGGWQRSMVHGTCSSRR